MENVSHQIDQWNANLYDESHSFVSKYGNSLIKLLAPLKGERILDLGCGTGDLAKRLFEQGAQVIGVDKSNNMSFFRGLDEEEQEEIIKRIEHQLKSSLFHDNQWIADYKRIRVIAVKE